MKNAIFCVLILIHLSSSAQSTNSCSEIHKDTAWQEIPHSWRFDYRRSFGIYPEVQFINSPVIGISASYAHLKDVEWSSFSKGVNLGFEFDPVQKFYGPKASVWGDIFALFLGLNASVSVMYYLQGDFRGLYLRPEIGIGIPRLHLKYGFGFRMVGDELSGIQRHSLTLGYHFTLVKRRM